MPIWGFQNKVYFLNSQCRDFSLCKQNYLDFPCSRFKEGKISHQNIQHETLSKQQSIWDMSFFS